MSDADQQQPSGRAAPDEEEVVSPSPITSIRASSHGNPSTYPVMESPPPPPISQLEMPASGFSELSTLTTPAELYHNQQLYPSIGILAEDEEAAEGHNKKLYPGIGIPVELDVGAAEALATVEEEAKQKSVSNSHPVPSHSSRPDVPVLEEEPSHDLRPITLSTTEGDEEMARINDFFDECKSSIQRFPESSRNPHEDPGTRPGAYREGGSTPSGAYEAFAPTFGDIPESAGGTGAVGGTEDDPPPPAAEVAPAQGAHLVEDPEPDVEQPPTPDSPDDLPEANVVLDNALQLLPVAQAFENMTRRKAASRRMFLGSLLFGLLAVIGITLGAYFGVKQKEDSSHIPADSVPTMPPSKHARDAVATEIWYQIARASHQEEWLAEDVVASVVNSTTPTPAHHLRALQWLLYEDPLQLPPNALNLLQRFFVAYFYFATTVHGPWVSCNPFFMEQQDLNHDKSTNNHHPGAIDLDRCYYIQYVGLGYFRGGTWYSHLPSDFEEAVATRWLSAQHECQWAGLFCNDRKEIEYLHLDKMNLTGTLPLELFFLEELRSVSLSNNGLQGELPAMLASLGHLASLNLASNQFTGTIPVHFWHTQLEYLDLEVNPLDKGFLPTDIGMSTALRHILLQQTNMTGPLPMELFQLTQLQNLKIRWNQITGTLGTEIGLLSNLEILSMAKNELYGTMPSELGLLTAIQELDLFKMNLEGTIPEELYSENLEQLNALILGYNNLSGTLSSLVANLPDLSHLLLQGMPLLIGTVPTELGLLEDFMQLQVYRNGMTGTMPDEVCKHRSDAVLSSVGADCLPIEEGNISSIAMVCPEYCCTRCCNQVTKECVRV